MQGQIQQLQRILKGNASTALVFQSCAALGNAKLSSNVEMLYWIDFADVRVKRSEEFL